MIPDRLPLLQSDIAEIEQRFNASRNRKAEEFETHLKLAQAVIQYQKLRKVAIAQSIAFVALLAYAVWMTL